MTDEIYVRLTKLPDKVYAFTIPGDGCMNVYISEQLNREMQLEVYQHELKHIKRNDFEGGDIQMIEYNAHKGE